jgi:NADP-dependent 3-hydroxy acid dehydrogenase YdfG
VSYPPIDLDGAVVLVTGGGRGIGRATGALFRERGATVCLADLDLPAAEEAAAATDAHAFGVDVADRTSFAACVAAVTSRFGRIDVLVNNAGVMPLGGFVEQPEALDATTLDVNVRGVIHGMRLVLPQMLERGSGHLVTVASMAGKLPLPGMAVYNASKFAALGLSRAVRAEYAESGVSVSTVLPAAVRTGLASGVTLGGLLPTAEPADVARAVVGSVRTRRAEIPVPGWLAVFDLVDALTPEPVMRLVRRIVDDTRALTGVDHEARHDYAQRIADQAAVREMRNRELDKRT